MITFTDAAKEYLAAQVIQNDTMLRLIYDLDGCGCGVDGIPVLIMASRNDAGKDDMFVETNGLPVAIEKSDLIYFDEDLTIDYKNAAHSLQLKSPNQLVSGNMTLIRSLSLL